MFHRTKTTIESTKNWIHSIQPQQKFQRIWINKNQEQIFYKIQKRQVTWGTYWEKYQFSRRSEASFKGNGAWKKIIYTLRNLIPTFLMKTVLNAFVISHLHYSLLLTQSIDKNLLISIEKQLNWAIRACYSRNRMDWTKDLKINLSTLPVEYLIKLKRTTYMWKLRKCLLPEFNPLDVTTLPTWCVRQNIRSCYIFFNFICHILKLERSITKTASKDWNSIPKELRGLEKKKTFPKELKKFYIQPFSDNKQFRTYGSVVGNLSDFNKNY